ncbi:TKL family protein kinase [Tritrichomonas foetus]|uniref:TKL family protein kinase n=1 Tax=Tritrichomonas foetus TaxID=1144522 RepID=A0A1J4KQG4_9EUKA|nr:TKL family protein kinase [Tritrichomonas foetus]|eukprot:OHT11677.1 TKL family protein kinase [Tritrichomonas foetus]
MKSHYPTIELIQNKVLSLQNRQITAYIHCSKLNDCWLALKKIPNLLENYNSSSKGAQYTSQCENSLSSILSIVDQLEDLFTQCSKDTCVQFLLSTSVSAPKDEIRSLRDAAVSAFRQLDIPEGVELFKLSKDELDLQDSVDMKRIAQVLIQISLKGRDDIKKSLTSRFNSLKRLGISISRDDTTDLTVPELPPNLRLVMKHEEIEIGKKIGNGQSGVVQLGTIKKTGEVVAVKILHRRALSQPEVESFRREIYALSVLNDSTLVCFRGYTEEPPFYIITEYMPNGSLFDVLRTKPQELTPTIRSLIAYDVARGIEYLHDRKIIHRDLKSLNILLDANFRAKICDFGMVRTRSQTPMTGMIGTAHWMAPEVVMSSPYYNEKVDVYSFAILLWELLTGDMPYQKLSQVNITLGIIQGTLRPPLPDDTPPKLSELIQKCWNQDPNKRPSMNRVVSNLKQARYHFAGTDETEFAAKAGISTHKKRHRSKIEITMEPEELIKALNDPNSAGRATLIATLGEMLTKRNLSSQLAKAGGCQLLINIINENSNESEAIMKKLQQCKSKKVFDAEVLKALLSCSNSNSMKIRRRAIQALVAASELRFHFISTPSFVTQLLYFLRKDIQSDVGESLLQLTQKLLSSVQALPDGIIQLLFEVRKTVDQKLLNGVDNCLLAAMKFPSAKQDFTKDNFIELLSDFKTTEPIISMYCEGVDHQQLDSTLISLLKNLDMTLELANFYSIIAHNPRFSRTIIKNLPFNKDVSLIANIYASLISDQDIDPRILTHQEFYNASSYLISTGRIDEVCNALKVCSPNPTLLLQSQLCQAIADAFLKSTDVTTQIVLMAAIFSTSKVVHCSCYKSILPKLTSYTSGEASNFVMPAFLCLSAIALHSKEGINFQNLLSTAAFYVNFESSLMREVSARVIKEFINEKGVHVGKIAAIFVENFRAADNNVKFAAQCLHAATKSHRDVDSSLRSKISQIASM